MSKEKALFFLDIIEVLPEQLIHRKHMYLILLEYALKLLIALDLPFVFRVLEIVLFNILPKLLNHLWS
jgi:hypothetical protein